MVLDGEFSYDDQNQRALPFNVAIQELKEEMTLYVGSKSKSTTFSITNLNLSKNSDARPRSYLVIRAYRGRGEDNPPSASIKLFQLQISI